MIKNRLKRIWAEGKPTLNGWPSIGRRASARPCIAARPIKGSAPAKGGF